MTQIARAVLRNLIRELGGISEREYCAEAARITAKPPSAAGARVDRLEWIARQEEAAMRLARSRVAQAIAARPLKPFQPGDARLEGGEAATIVVASISRRFDLLRLEALR